MCEYIIRALLGLLLIILSIQDIKWKKIKLNIVLIAIVIISICLPFCSYLSVLDRLLGLSLGLGLVVLSKATGGKIGVGDGLVMGVTGIGLGFWTNMELFVLALAMAALFSIVLMVLGKANGKSAIPFMPFIFCAYMLISIPLLGIGG